MQALIVTFSLQPHLGTEEYRTMREERAPAYLDIPGMVGKIWISNAEENRHGAIYLFASTEHASAYLNGPLASAMNGHPDYRDFDVQQFDVGEAASRITNGWIEPRTTA